MPLLRLIWAEPLVRFALVAALIFVVYQCRQPEDDRSPETISISQARIDSWRAEFRRGNGRIPTEQEQQQIVQQWIDEELLYRQALKLGLHLNDSIVRRQLIEKMDFVLEGATPQPATSDAELQAYLDEHSQKYGQPPTVSFEQVFVSRGNHGSQLQQAAEQALSTLQSAPDDFRQLGDTAPGGQIITTRNQQQLRRQFGQPFVEQLDGLSEGIWQGPIASGLGLHLVRITRRQPFQPAALADVRGRVERDYRQYRQQQARRAALDALQEGVVVRVGAASLPAGEQRVVSD